MNTRATTSRFRASGKAILARAGATILALGLALPAAAHAQAAAPAPAPAPAPAAARAPAAVRAQAARAVPGAGNAEGARSTAGAAASPVMDALRQVSQRYEANLVGSAKEMPADKYGYKPTAQQRTFGALMLHVARSNEFFCSSISGQPQPKGAQLEPTSPKDALVNALEKSFNYCTNVLSKVNDSELDAQVPFFGNRKVTRATAVMGLAEDWADHYGQAAMYLRLNGMLPPSAQRRGGM
jgi:uncharacterized damage-inducible protein DinB